MVVKIVTKKLGEKFYKKKAVVKVKWSVFDFVGEAEVKLKQFMINYVRGAVVKV